MLETSLPELPQRVRLSELPCPEGLDGADPQQVLLAKLRLYFSGKIIVLAKKDDGDLVILAHAPAGADECIEPSLEAAILSVEVVPLPDSERSLSLGA